MNFLDGTYSVLLRNRPWIFFVGKICNFFWTQFCVKQTTHMVAALLIWPRLVLN